MRIIFPLAVVLDSTPLGLLTQKLGHSQGDVCRAWLGGLEAGGSRGLMTVKLGAE